MNNGAFSLGRGCPPSTGQMGGYRPQQCLEPTLAFNITPCSLSGSSALVGGGKVQTEAVHRERRRGTVWMEQGDGNIVVLSENQQESVF